MSNMPSKHWTSRLFTSEDRFLVHKIFATTVVMSYAWRFLFLLGDDDLGFQRFPEFTFPTLLLHVSLNLSSFIFRIPLKRICNGDSRIWPEYRLHSLVFVTRSLAVIALNHVGLRHPYYNYLLVIASMLAGDVCSRSVQMPSRSIRDLNAPPVVKFSFSLMQFLVTATILVGLKRNTFYFYTALVIQITPFIMTLRRKNLVTHSFNVFAYGGLLLVGLCLGICEVLLRCNVLTLYIISLLGCTAALVRMKSPIYLLRNKYILWTLLFGILEGFLRPLTIVEIDTPSTKSNNMTIMVLVSLFCWIEMLGIIYYGWTLYISHKN